MSNQEGKKILFTWEIMIVLSYYYEELVSELSAKLKRVVVFN